MTIFWHIRNLARKLSGQETLEEERFRRLLVVKKEFSTARDELHRLLNDFTLDSIVISKPEGVVIGNGGSRIESIKGSALFEFIKSELPDADYVMVRVENGTRVIYSDGEYIYIAKAKGYVSPLEMKLLSKKFRREEYGE